MSWLQKSTDKTEHRWVEERLSAYLDGELSVREQRNVDRHLTTCRACQWQLDTLRQTVQWTSELPTVPVPRVFAVPAPSRRVPAPPRRWPFVPVLQGATVLVALLLVFMVAGDVLFTGVLSPGLSRQEIMLESAPAAVEVTREVEARVEVEAEVVVETVVVEKEVVVEEAVEVMEEAPMAAEPAAEGEIPTGEAASEALASPLPQMVAPTGELRVEKAATAPTPSPEGTRMGAMGFEPPAEKEAGDIVATEALEAPHAPTPTVTVAPADAIAATMEPTPTLLPPAPPPAPATITLPTAVAQVQERAPRVSDEVEQRSMGPLRRPAITWLRVTELALGIVLIVLGSITIVAMIQRRGPR